MENTIDTIYNVSEKYGKYPPGAYVMVFEILDFVATNVQRKHLTGRELALSAFVFALQKYGLLAKDVWESMNMFASEDLGAIVFHLVECGLISRQEEDRVEDFNNIFTSKDFADTKMSLVGEGEKWIHSYNKDKGLNLELLPPDKLGLNIKEG